MKELLFVCVVMFSWQGDYINDDGDLIYPWEIE